MKKLLVALMMVAGVTAANAEVTGNMSLTSDYRFRGISQSQNAPAVQGGIDYAHSSGLYIGNWNSSVSSQLYTNGSGVESDLYAGFKTKVMGEITADVGTMNNFYPRATNGTSTNFDTNELYVGLGYKEMFSVKYSQSLSNYFGVADSKNSQYFQADAAIPLAAGFTAVAHAGRTSVNNNSSLNYTDYNVGVAYDLQGWMLAGKYYANTTEGSGFQTANTVNGQRLYKDTFVVSVSKTF